MTRIEVLCLLRELVQGSAHTITDPDDLSGLSTVYLVDQERLLAHIEANLEIEEKD